jgi:beta-aspartyl-dipeptidase (metallo-type)
VGLTDQRFELLERALDADLLKPSVVTLTHVNWSREIALEAAGLARRGVNLDITACIRPDRFPGSLAPVEALWLLLDAEVPIERLSISSDAGGAHRDPDTGAVFPDRPSLLLEALQEVTSSDLLPTSQALELFTVNPADRVGLGRSGRIEPGARGDLLVFDEGMVLESMLLGGRPVGSLP